MAFVEEHVMDSYDGDIEMSIEPEDPTRPTWLLDDPTWIDEPLIGAPFEPAPATALPR